MRICLLNRYFDFRGTGVTRIATEVTRELEQRGHEVIKIATDGTSLYAYAWKTGVVVPCILPRNGIDAYHALATLEGMWIPKNRGIATFLDLFTTTNPDRAGAGMGYSRWKLEVGRRYFALGSRIAAQCRFLVCISEKTRQDVLEHVTQDEAKIRVIRLGIRDDLRPEPRRQPHRWQFGTLSQLDKRKRIDLLVRTFHATRLDADLWIAGQGPDRTRLEEQAAADPRIHFDGLIPDNQLCAWYNKLDAFIFPTGIEGYGLPAVEAMACGLPVVVLQDAIIPHEIKSRCHATSDLRGFFQSREYEHLTAVAKSNNLAFAREHRWSRCVDQYISLYRQIKEDAN